MLHVFFINLVKVKKFDLYVSHNIFLSWTEEVCFCLILFDLIEACMHARAVAITTMTMIRFTFTCLIMNRHEFSSDEDRGGSTGYARYALTYPAGLACIEYIYMYIYL